MKHKKLKHKNFLGWIEVKLDEEYKIPLPKEAKDCSGKFVVRIPKTL